MRRKGIIRRIFAAFLAITMLVSVCPQNVLATEMESIDETVFEEEYQEESSVAESEEETVDEIVSEEIINDDVINPEENEENELEETVVSEEIEEIIEQDEKSGSDETSSDIKFYINPEETNEVILDIDDVINNGIHIGDYIYLGRYNGQPIKWRCVDIDENGPLMLSDKILSLKAFDAKGDSSLHAIPSTPFWNIRFKYGSNCWKDSNLREWLNSIDENVQWSHDTPNEKNVFDGRNAYDNEEGFLSIENFTEFELNCIKTVTRKVYVNSAENYNSTIDGGYSIHVIRDGANCFWESVDRYEFDESKYYQVVTDRMFIPDSMQIGKVYDNLGIDYVISYPTSEAINQSNYEVDDLNINTPWVYWINHPDNVGGWSHEHVNTISATGHVDVGINGSSAGAYYGNIGVRPAFYFNGGSNLNDDEANSSLKQKVILLDDGTTVGEMELVYNDDYFIQPSGIYNHNLAKFASKMSLLCYQDEQTIVNAITKFGFQEYVFYKYGELKTKKNDLEEYSKDVSEEEKKYKGTSSPYWIMHKKSGDSTIIIVAIMGTDKNDEWYDNFDPGIDATHRGFDNVANQVCDSLLSYISDNEIDINNLKILVTGHSRGAAAANLVGKYIDDSEKYGKEHNNKYIYTFATPNVSRDAFVPLHKYSDMGGDKSNPNIYGGGSQYNNIYNIVNPEDFVTKVLLSKWGYGRFGKTYVLPSRTTDSKTYDSYLSKLREKVAEYKSDYTYKVFLATSFIYRTEVGFSPYPDGMASISDYVDYVSDRVTDIDGYYNTMLGDNPEYDTSLYILYYNSLANFAKDAKKKAIPFFKSAALDYYGAVGRKTVAFFFSNGFLSTFFQYGHSMEGYAAAMDVITASEIKERRKMLKGIINCPIDVTVTDNNGDVLGKIVDNKVIDSYSGIQMKVEGDSKSFYLPSDGNYKVELIGNDNGTLDYSICEIDADIGEVSRVFYNDLDVSVEEGGGIKYVQNFVEDTPIEDLILINADDEVIEPTIVLDAEEIESLSVEVTVEGDGYVNSLSNLSPGDYPILHAEETELSYFKGWYDIEGNLLGIALDYGFSISENTKLIAKFEAVPDGLYVKLDKESYVYDGKAIKPEITVYDRKTVLQAGKDYTVKYSNNVNVGTGKITITGKGNYSSTETVEFTILPENISGESFVCDPVTIKLTGKAQKPVPVLMWNNKKLAAKNFTYEYYKADEVGDPTGDKLLAVTDTGKYVIVLKGIGNFTGERKVELTVAGSENLISKAAVAKIANQTYTGVAITPDVTVTFNKQPLKKGTDYTVSYTNNTNIGTATAIITGIGNYAGIKKVNFNITGMSINKAVVTGISNAVYTGNEITFDGIGLYLKASGATPQVNLAEGTDYTLKYEKNTNVGTATIIITGINRCSGTIKKTFKITPYKVAEDSANRINVSLNENSIVHSKGGAKPAVTVTFKNKDDSISTLTEGKDYTVKYTNNTAVNDGTNDRKRPTATVTLKGNITGTVAKNYVITAKNISTVKTAAADVVYKDKKGNFATKVTLTDEDGKVLQAGKDYGKIIAYTYKNSTEVINNGVTVTRNAGVTVNPADIAPVQTVIVATVNAVGNYTGTVSAEYRITPMAITSAKVSIPNQTYTGKAIKPNAEDMTVKVGTTTLVAGTDFEVVENSYTNNINKGTAKVTIRGIGNYGGTKVVTFKIGARGFLWWWRK